MRSGLNLKGPVMKISRIPLCSTMGFSLVRSVLGFFSVAVLSLVVSAPSWGGEATLHIIRPAANAELKAGPVTVIRWTPLGTKVVGITLQQAGDTYSVIKA